jgi:glycosyltransferase involved in cell wall biosynthesis
MKTEESNPRLVFDFVHSPAGKLEEVMKGEAPREALLGYIQLSERGWTVSASDDRWGGAIGALRTRLRGYIEIPSIRMIAQWNAANIVVVVTRISLVLAILAKLLNKKLVFLDAMQELPDSVWQRFLVRRALKMADAAICYSDNQAHHWANSLGIDERVFVALKYGVDGQFYSLPEDGGTEEEVIPYILTVGRDPQRDFDTLVSAADVLGWELRLVTLPYLVPEGIRNNPKVEVLQRIEYKELFKLYTNAKVVVVPVKRGTTYMSGIRATMEAMLLKAPVLASRVAGLEEYFHDGDELLFFEPEDPEDLVCVIRKIDEEEDLRSKIVSNARKRIIDNYSVSVYADALETVFRQL